MGLYLCQAYKQARVYRLQQLQSEIHIFHSNNGIIEYQCVGSGKPVLVFHGLLGSYEHGRNAMWQFDLSQYQLITISRIGYTLTCDQSHTSLTQQADAIAELLTHLNIDECTVIAMSAGGPAGIVFAARHTQKVGRLILLEAITRPFEYRRLGVLTIFGLLYRTVNSDPLAWLITRSIVKTLPVVALFSRKTKQRILQYSDRREVYERVTYSFFPTEFMTHGYKYDLQSLQELDTLPLSEIGCPTLILHGEADEVVPLNHSEFAAEQIPHSKFVTVGEEADHDFHITHADFVWDTIFGFLETEQQLNQEDA